MNSPTIGRFYPLPDGHWRICFTVDAQNYVCDFRPCNYATALSWCIYQWSIGRITHGDVLWAEQRLMWEFAGVVK